MTHPTQAEPRPLASDPPIRRLSVKDHEDWQSALAPLPADFDDIDDAASDPIRDHTPRHQSQRKVRGVLGALDRLAKESSNRRCNS